MPVTVNGSGPISGVSQVSQSQMPLVGGSPIVESGSNANGSWTKWADGTMICTGGYTGPITMGGYAGVTGLSLGTLPVTLPQTFVGPFFPFVGAAQDNTSNGWMCATPTANNAMNIIYYSANPSVTGTNITYGAVGRWK